MKRAAAFILGLAAGAGAQAQTQVAIYGIIDAGLVIDKGGSGGHRTKVSSGVGSTSRLGFRGDEKLGNGLSAFFVLETGSRVDSGEVDAAGTIFNRQAMVGLKGDFGQVALGRQYTPVHLLLVAFDPFNSGYAGTIKNLFPDSGTNVRTSNTVTYKSPTVRGFSGELSYALGEQSDSATGRQFGGAIGYASGPLALRLAHNSKNTDAAATATAPAVSRELGRNTTFGATYKLPLVKLHFIYGVDKGFNSSPLPNTGNPYGGVRPTASTDARDVLLGLSAPLGSGTLMFSVQNKNDRTSFDQDATSIGIGYLYALSKRTSLYAAYAHIDNRNGAGYTVNNNSETGTGNAGYNLGIRHAF